MFSCKHIFCAAAGLSLALFTTSCLETSDSETFQPSVTGYVIQSYAADSSLVFSPFFSVSSNLATEALQTVTFTGLNTNFAMTKASDYVFVNNPDLYKTTELSKLNGTYTITATSTNNTVSTSTITISIADADTLGVVRATNLTYDGTTVKVSVPKVKNAASYGVILVPFEKGDTPQRVSTYFFRPNYTTMSADSVVSYSVSFSQSQLGSDSAYIRAYATGSSGLYQESSQLVRIAKIAESE